MNFYEKLQKICMDKNTSPSAVARKIGLSNSAATYWKKGSTPKYGTLRKIAKVLDVQPHNLLSDKELQEVQSMLPELKKSAEQAYSVIKSDYFEMIMYLDKYGCDAIENIMEQEILRCIKQSSGKFTSQDAIDEFVVKYSRYLTDNIVDCASKRIIDVVNYCEK